MAIRVCWDSGTFASRFYEQCFAGTRFGYDPHQKKTFGRREFGAEKRIWVDLRKDTIFSDKAASLFYYSSDRFSHHITRIIAYLDCNYCSITQGRHAKLGKL